VIQHLLEGFGFVLFGCPGGEGSKKNKPHNHSPNSSFSLWGVCSLFPFDFFFLERGGGGPFFSPSVCFFLYVPSGRPNVWPVDEPFVPCLLTEKPKGGGGFPPFVPKKLQIFKTWLGGGGVWLYNGVSGLQRNWIVQLFSGSGGAPPLFVGRLTASKANFWGFLHLFRGF